MGFEVLMNGVGNAFSRRHWGTNFIVQSNGYHLGVDCPDSYRRALAENDFAGPGDGEGALDVDALDAMFITHLHGDHVNGLEMVLAYRRYVVGEPLDLYTTPPVAEALWERRLGVSLGRIWNGERHENLEPEDFYRLHRVPWGESTEIGPFRVTTRETIHHLPASALRISDGEVTCGYSCDTAFDESLIEWLADADRIFHETSIGPGHTPLDELEDLEASIREKMLLVHLPEELADAGDATDLEFAEEGRVYPVE